MNRRNFIAAASVVAGLATTASSANAAAAAKAPPPPAPKAAPGGEAAKPFQIGMVIFEQMTNLDFVGPQDSLARVRAAKIHVIAKTLDPITTDSNHRILADTTFAQAPELDMLFIPGGPGTTQIMQDPEVLAFLRDRAPRAQWVTSVCTGALVLGAAGLLKGYRAATHWAFMDILPTLGAIPVNERVVIDRNRVTGGGVTAGIDFGLTLIGKIWGDDLAKLIQLGQEYNPAPPYDAGSPDRVPEVAARFRKMTAGMHEARLEAAKRAMAGLA